MFHVEALSLGDSDFFGAVRPTARRCHRLHPVRHRSDELESGMAISEHYAEIRRKVGTLMILVSSLAAIIRDENGWILFQKKADETWSLPAGAIEPGEAPALAVGWEVQEETGSRVKPERSWESFVGDGFRYQYSNGDQDECTFVLFEYSHDGRPSNSTTKKPKLAREEPPPLGLAYPASLFSASSVSTYFEQANG
jgi:8-oxo-dGTP pyrophosphatase MutT (NUDIX family)